MRIVYLDDASRKNLLEDLLKRSPNQYGEYEQKVGEILKQVKEEGDQAVFAFTERFDGAKIDASNIEVTEEEIEEAYTIVEPSLLDVIRKALVNIEMCYKRQENRNI